MRHRSFALLICACALPTTAFPDTEWRYYGGSAGSDKYSPVAQIDASNVKHLQPAWSWVSPDDALVPTVTKERPGFFKPTPLMIGGVLYTSTGFSQVAAIDAGSGKTIWTFDPQAYLAGRRPANSGWQHRGVAYWEGRVGNRTERRILIATGTGELIALDATSGALIDSFGRNGRVDVQAALIRREEDRRFVGFNAPPMIVNDVVVLGCTVFDRPTAPQMPAGHIQAFDVRTGAPKWIFHTVPQDKEPGVETWGNESWKYSGNTNAWAPMSADPELGLVYVPVGTPTNDYFGGDRPGNNLYAESLLALDARTGKLAWHFQGVHHGLWDYDFPAAPTLADITVDGKRIKAIAQISKQGFTYVFDRATGKPVWPIEERAVPQSTVPGEKTAATQPFPTKPPPFARQGITTDDLIDFTPELRAEAIRIASEYTMGPLFTPPTIVGENGKKGVLQVPSAAGGANWGGSAFDPELGYLYLESANILSMAAVVKGDPARHKTAYLIQNPVGPSGPQGLPLLKPPYGVVTAIDLNKGEIAWQVAHGDGPRDHPLLKALNLPPLGASSHTFLSSGGPLVTKSLLFVNQVQTRSDGPGYSTTEFFMRAFDKKTGAVVWEHKMKEPPFGTPMTYELKGKQYVVVSTGGAGAPGKLVAFALP
ncbi:quinoprotein glucose dehydrogenase [Povalibacter uvarum]|uniref:Quinoprotein glucose dehydrogenase n=1 Tax=Povalibacter uvarum TaxID=732238 RepID=A0A841HKP7_9GAMM|nr:pyrroloquinoline quinone-dependent dehydrogenase [Povalibacter uvarum]MBB6092949.1 quinoprotein glucose dehydrogenase [Povalibacter uvarum]